MQNSIGNKRLNISILRILATLAVVFLHTNSGILDRPDLFVLQEHQRDFLALGKQYMNWAVPVFLMITGSLLLRRDKQISFYECISKYVRRILLALFCFGIPFSMMEIFLERHSIDVKMLFEAVIHVISGNSWAHLWYLYMLIGVYCLLPVFKRFADAAPRMEMRSILITLFLFQMMIPIIEIVSGISVAFEIPLATNAVFYLFMGKYLSDELPKGLRRKSSSVLYLICAFVLAGYVYLSTHTEGLLEHFAPVYAILIFSLFQNVDIPDRICSLIWKIDRLCFGVYLIHPLFINFMYKFLKITPLSFNSYWIMTFLFFLFFAACSFCASKIMSMVPPLKRYIL